MVVESVGAASIEEVPAKPEDKGADAKPNRGLILGIVVGVVELVNSVGAKVIQILLGEFA